VSVTVPADAAEEARAVLLALFPGGFEEAEAPGGALELAAYTDGEGEVRLRAAFGAARAETVPDDWQDRWREFHRPVRIGPLWIGPPWEQAPDDATSVVIDPGRAFGTGAHATTRLCLALLLDLDRGSAVDVGCGSGVLAIAAARLGFGPVLALDVDPAAVEATLANAEANGVTLYVRQADARIDDLPAADHALLNVSAETVAEVAPRLEVSTIVASGYLAEDRPHAIGFRTLRRVEEEGWAADLLGRDAAARSERKSRV
jgi:ribosomal protein L11 methyltransferase